MITSQASTLLESAVAIAVLMGALLLFIAAVWVMFDWFEGKRK